MNRSLAPTALALQLTLALCLSTTSFAQLQDGSFEGGDPNPYWSAFSTNFGTPLCTEAICGLGAGSGPRTGQWWAWFGGVDAFEEGSLSQLVTVPDQPGVSLSFYQELPVCSGSPSDFFEINLGGLQIYLVRATDVACGQLGYVKKTIPIEGFRGQTVVLELYSNTLGGATTNFFIDDVSITPALGQVLFSEDFELGNFSTWSNVVANNNPPLIRSVLSTWSELSDGRAIEIRSSYDVGGSSGIPALLGPGLPREVDLDLDDDGVVDADSPLLAQAMGVLRGGNGSVVPGGALGAGLPSSMALVVAEGSDPENDDLIYRWQFPLTPNVSYYSTGSAGSAFPTGELITNVANYNRNSVLIEAPDISFPLLDAGIHIGGLFPVTVSVTDAAHAQTGCPPGVPNSCRSYWNFEYDRGIELDLREVRGQLLDLNQCDHPVPGDPDIGQGNPADTVEVTFIAGINAPNDDVNRFEALTDVHFRVACQALGLGVGDDHIVDMPPGGPTSANVNPSSYLARNPRFIGTRVGGGARLSCRYPLADPEASCASTNAWKSSTSISVVAGTFGPSTGAWPFVEEAPSYPPLTIAFAALDVYGPTLGDRQSVPIEAFETEEVTFTLFDSGSLADDSFLLEIDGIAQGTTPAGGESVFGPNFVGLGELTAGDYEACVTVTLAPDNIGTYTLTIFGATFAGGGTVVSAAPPQNTRRCYDFEVPLNRIHPADIPIGDGSRQPVNPVPEGEPPGR